MSESNNDENPQVEFSDEFVARLKALIRQEIEAEREERKGCTIPNDPIGIISP